jgi:glycosyltransferase involved in cell wall biosynthesis
VSVGTEGARPPEGYFLFAGRLSEEKGVRTLLAAWREGAVPAQLRIAGAGPLEGLVRQAAEWCPRIRYLGPLSRDDLLAQLGAAAALIFPSEWYEGLPMIVLEAFGAGRPVLAARGGAVEEVVRDGETGSFFPRGDAAELATLARWAIDHPEALAAMGRDARREYERCYTAEANYPQLLAIYGRAARSVASGDAAGSARSEP